LKINPLKYTVEPAASDVDLLSKKKRGFILKKNLDLFSHTNYSVEPAASDQEIEKVCLTPPPIPCIFHVYFMYILIFFFNV
jgi:hypothetical protein